MVALTIETATLISEEGVVESSLLGENVIIEAEINFPIASSELIATIAPSDELKVPITNLPVELTHPSSLLAITQGSY